MNPRDFGKEPHQSLFDYCDLCRDVRMRQEETQDDEEEKYVRVNYFDAGMMTAVPETNPPPTLDTYPYQLTPLDLSIKSDPADTVSPRESELMQTLPFEQPGHAGLTVDLINRVFTYTLLELGRLALVPSTTVENIMDSLLTYTVRELNTQTGAQSSSTAAADLINRNLTYILHALYRSAQTQSRSTDGAAEWLNRN